MPIPTPQKGEKQDKFISRCNSVMAKEFPDAKQRNAVCFDAFRKSKKEKSLFQSRICGYEKKETEDGDLILKGYIATTHLDDGFLDPHSEKYVRDRIAKETLDKWADDLNAGIPSANKVSVNHNREPHVTGVAIKGTARVDMLPDGEYGLYTETLVDKTKDTFDDVSYRVDHNLLDSYSIEFTTKDYANMEYLPGAVVEHEVNGGIIRDLLPGAILEGYTLASQPMNPNAVMTKEILKSFTKEESKMTEKKEEAPAEEASEKVEEKVEEAPKEEAPAEEAEEAKELSKEDSKILKEAKERIAKETKEKEFTDIVSKVKEEVKESLKDVEVENKVAVNTGETEMKEEKEYKEAVKSGSKIGIDLQFKMAGDMADKCGFTDKGMVKVGGTPATAKEFKGFQINNNKLETKALGITTNQNSDTDYLLSAAELSDVFDPVIHNFLNQKITTWNSLPKVDLSQKGNNQVQFTIKTVRNSTASAYTGNAVTTGNVQRQKYMTKFKKYQVGVAVDGDMIAAARGGPVGDVFAQEVRDSSDDLMEVMNQALYAEVGLETAAGVIGFEYLADSAGNTSLYNVTRSAANQLAPDSAGNTYINGASADVSVANLRAAIRNAREEGASDNNLVFYCSPIQYDKIRGIYDAAQRLVPTSSRFGFEGLMSFDGIPVFFDKDCNDDDIFLIDHETHKIAIWVPPTLEMLGKDSDAEKGFIKSYWCTFNMAPRRIAMIYGNATS